VDSGVVDDHVKPHAELTRRFAQPAPGTLVPAQFTATPSWVALTDEGLQEGTP
jgi:hypothetical protein